MSDDTIDQETPGQPVEQPGLTAAPKSTPSSESSEPAETRSPSAPRPRIGDSRPAPSTNGGAQSVSSAPSGATPTNGAASGAPAKRRRRRGGQGQRANGVAATDQIATESGAARPAPSTKG